MSPPGSEPPPFLRVPPFPGALSLSLTERAEDGSDLSDDQVDRLINAIREARVGGTYWGAQPPLPNSPYVLVRVKDGDKRAEVLSGVDGMDQVLCWLDEPIRTGPPNHEVALGACDPWHLVSGASRVIVDANDELALVAAIAGKPIRSLGEGAFQGLDVTTGSARGLRDAFSHACLSGKSYTDPFTGEKTDFGSAIDLSAFWRNLIDGNRDISAAFGFAHWKRSAVAPLLWSGQKLRFASHAANVGAGDTVAVWRSRTPDRVVVELTRKDARLIEVEDGFIRSAGLGANCIPPLSIVVDRSGVHFDPRGPSDLERILQEGQFSENLIARAQSLRQLIVSSGVSKYGAGSSESRRRVAGRRHILVTGQVEDDRSVLEGGGEVRTNLELLRRARADAPDAYLLYKPHPDVEAGHRVGAIADATALELADEIVRDEGISALIEMVDELHVNTSLAGFEALLRGKRVTTHGVPFYAGWGLTRDLGAVPPRRTRKRTLDELVAAVLLIYPRYLDPDTGLPCPPEILVHRLTRPTKAAHQSVIARLRRWQGSLKRLLTMFHST